MKLTKFLCLANRLILIYPSMSTYTLSNIVCKCASEYYICLKTTR